MIRHALKGLVLVLLMVAVGFTGDTYEPNPAQIAAARYQYSLLEWEAGNAFDKWIHRLAEVMPWNRESHEARRAKVDQYFRLSEEISKLSGELEDVAAQEGSTLSDRAMTLEADLAEIKARRSKLRDDVEEVLESAISAILAEEGLSSIGGFIFPPVDARLTEAPKVLVTSPRDRIERKYDVLLDPDVTVSVAEGVERELLDKWDLSALVVDIGGLATYPATILNSQPLQGTLRIVAHEWLHHFFAFRPLGRHMFSTSNMTTLNETAADIIGREIGDHAFRLLGGEPVPPPPRDQTADETLVDDPGRFDFDREMRETRHRVDGLLADGRVEEAEAFMEERRRLFVENGYNIRKLNQAYFAFHGTYADNPASVSPIADQLQQFRDLTPDLGDFIRALAGTSSYEAFLAKLDRLTAETKDRKRPGDAVGAP